MAVTEVIGGHGVRLVVRANVEARGRSRSFEGVHGRPVMHGGRLRRGRMGGRGGVAGGGRARRAVGARGRKILRLAPPECLSFLVGVERPVFGDVVPNVPLQVVGVVLHDGHLFDNGKEFLLLLFPQSIFKRKNKIYKML